MLFFNIFPKSIRFYSSTSSSIKSCLSEFNKLILDQSSVECVYEGWPPKHRIDINNNMKPLGRKLMVINRRLDNGIDFEPTLVFCCDSKPMLMMSRTEFNNFVSNLPQIKSNLDTFYKQL